MRNEDFVEVAVSSAFRVVVQGQKTGQDTGGMEECFREWIMSMKFIKK